MSLYNLKGNECLISLNRKMSLDNFKGSESDQFKGKWVWSIQREMSLYNLKGNESDKFKQKNESGQFKGKWVWSV